MSQCIWGNTSCCEHAQKNCSPMGRTHMYQRAQVEALREPSPSVNAILEAPIPHMGARRMSTEQERHLREAHLLSTSLPSSRTQTSREQKRVRSRGTPTSAGRSDGRPIARLRCLQTRHGRTRTERARRAGFSWSLADVPFQSIWNAAPSAAVR